METGKDIELRSEAVQEVMGHVPSRIVRWGITVLFAVVLMLVVGSFFFRYPDVVEAEMTLTSRNPVTEVVARTSGRVSNLYVADGQEVKEGLPLAVVENTAVTEDVFRLKKLLARYAGEPERLGYYLLQDVWRLGDIQSAYTALASKDPASRGVYSCCGRDTRTCMCRVATCLRGSCRKIPANGSGWHRCRSRVRERYGKDSV